MTRETAAAGVVQANQLNLQVAANAV